MSDDTHIPDRPIPAWQKPLRQAVRSARVLQIRARYRGTWRAGEEFAIGAGAVLATEGPISIGDRVHVGRNWHVEVALEVGDDVLVSSNVSMIGNDHSFSDPHRTIYTGERLPQARVILEGDNLVGFGSTLIGNIRVGRGAILGARSVVTRDVPPGAIMAGVPARRIGTRPGH